MKKMKRFQRKDEKRVPMSKGVLFLGGIILLAFIVFVCPVFISIRKKQSVEALRVAYSTLLQANKMYTLAVGDNMNEYDTGLHVKEFAEKYFTPYLSISAFCKNSQSGCWKSPQYKDLKNRKMFNKSQYSIVLSNKSVLGFYKNKAGLVSIILDIDGPAGINKLGRDVFIFYVYNSSTLPKICDDSVYTGKNIQNGIYLGGYDKCGIPHDSYEYKDLISKNLYEACNKKAPTDDFGLGAGAACATILQKNDWLIDKKYPW